MRIKSFFVHAVDDAIEQARAEFGEEALLLSTKKTAQGYEVVFGSDQEDGEEGSLNTDPSPNLLSGHTGLSAEKGDSLPCPQSTNTDPAPYDLRGQSGLSPFSAPSENPAERGDSLLCPQSTNTNPAPDALRGQSGLSPFSAPSENPAPSPSPKTEKPAEKRHTLFDRHSTNTGRPPNGPSGQKGQPPFSAPSEESLQSIRREVEEIRLLLLLPDRKRSTQASQILARLVDAGLDPLLASQIVDAADAAAPAIPFKDRLRLEIVKRIPIDPTLGVPGHDGSVVALVGPGGAGKTTTLMKIAAFQASPERPVRLLALDHSSLAARMQLQLFARKNAVQFSAVEAGENLAEIVANARQDEIVLIDTPSCPDREVREKLAAVLNACPGIDVHMTAPAYMSREALRHAIAQYRVFRPSKLVITKLDESPAFGAAASAAARAGLKISLLTNGVSIPRDLYAASPEDLVSMALGTDTQAACA